MLGGLVPCRGRGHGGQQLPADGTRVTPSCDRASLGRDVAVPGQQGGRRGRGQGGRLAKPESRINRECQDRPFLAPGVM